MALRWYVVHAYSNFEHRVAEALKDRVKLQGLQDKFGEILVPTEAVVEMRDGQKRKATASSSPAMCWCKWKWTRTPGISSKRCPRCSVS
jgi:transcriptional antiterminator NusG